MSTLTFLLPPSLTGSTTMAAIRDRMVRIIVGLTPTTESGVRFTQHRHERLDLFAWAEQNPSACFRVFSVRDTGEHEQPEVSNTDVESEERIIEVAIAYPSTNRWGDTLDRDEVIDQDSIQVNRYVGTDSFGTIADATTITQLVSREDGDAATFAVIRIRAVFYRSQS